MEQNLDIKEAKEQRFTKHKYYAYLAFGFFCLYHAFGFLGRDTELINSKIDPELIDYSTNFYSSSRAFIIYVLGIILIIALVEYARSKISLLRKKILNKVLFWGTNISIFLCLFLCFMNDCIPRREHIFDGQHPWYTVPLEYVNRFLTILVLVFLVVQILRVGELFWSIFKMKRAGNKN